MRKIHSKECLYCACKFETKKLKTRFCSISCGSKWNHKNNPNFLHTKENIKLPLTGKLFSCQVCKKGYYVSPKRFKKTRYCSARCRSVAVYAKHGATMLQKSVNATKGKPSPRRGVPHTPEVLRRIVEASIQRSMGYASYHHYLDKSGRSLPLKSSWEIAFVQQYLDAYDLDWVYEPKIFELPSGLYVPDFYVDEQGKQTWYEIKGRVEERSLKRIEEMKDKYGITINLLDYDGLRQMGICLKPKTLKNIMQHWRIY